MNTNSILNDDRLKSKKSWSERELFFILIRIPKNDCAFFYFLLESHEGLCFYSTIDHIEGQDYRDIELNGDYHLKVDIINLIKKFKELSPQTTILQERINRDF